MAKDKVLFLHIPRCGGTTVWRAIRGIYGRPKVFHISNRENRAAFDAMTPEGRRSFSAIGGHAPLNVFSEALGGLDNFYSVLTVRDPIDRLISNYNYIRGKPGHPRHAEVSGQSFAAYALAERGNLQATYLTGDIPTPSAALAALEGFDDWAFSSEVGALIRRLATRAGRRRWIVSRRNRSPQFFRRDEIDPDLDQVLRRRNAVDIAVVEALKARPAMATPRPWWERLLGA